MFKNSVSQNQSPIIIVYGVSGSGKSTIAELVAQNLDLPYFDADDFHPPVNIAKMKAGTPLDDGDRLPWLQAIRAQINIVSNVKGGVFACSALKESYRKILSNGATPFLFWCLLHGEFDLIYQRMLSRNHFMPPHLLKSQFKDLEIPNYGLTLDVADTKEQLVEKIIQFISQPAKHR